MMMRLLVLVCSLVDLGSIVFAVSSDAPTNQAQTELADIRNKILSLESSLAKKDSYVLQKDEEILLLEKEIEEWKEHNKEKLNQLKSKIDDDQTRLQEVLGRKTRELDNMRREIHSLENYRERQSLEVKQLEQTVENERKSLTDIQKTLHVTEETVLQLQSYLESNIRKAKKGKWKEKILSHVCEVRKTLKDKFELIVVLSRPYVDEPFALLEPYTYGLWVRLKPFAMKLAQKCDELIKSAIMFHLKLQQNTWILLKRNKYLTPLATSKEIVWLLATGFVVFPVYGVIQFLTFLDRQRGLRRTHVGREST